MGSLRAGKGYILVAHWGKSQLNPRFLARLLMVTGLILGAFLGTGLLGYLVTSKLPWQLLALHDSGVRLYASLAVPALLVTLNIGGLLVAGLTSQFTENDNQELWARSGGWLLIIVLGWSASHLLVLFGPSVALAVLKGLQEETIWRIIIKGFVPALLGGISGFVTIKGLLSPKQQTDIGSRTMRILRELVAAVFGGVVIIVFVPLAAYLTNFILASGFANWLSRFVGGPGLYLRISDSRGIIYGTPGRLLVVVALLLAGVGVLLGRFINTNRFSLHYYWRNRMMRAYMGASRLRTDRDRTKNWFTDFDMRDNLAMHQLKQKPLHVVVATLNLVGGDRLEWQDRKGESFSISPRHAGSYWLGYRDSRRYGDGITLATAAAISGAAASPNMGFMMTSPIVRIFLTVFNVRMGFWLGNPGIAGDRPGSRRQPTFDRNCPRSSVRPIVAEALGLTNDKHPYVYLSDGGHFENLGLYEMILRRCRFIVVSDASSDADYDFQSLALAIRQIRVDFGVPIEMEKMAFGNNPPEVQSNYCAVGKIRYSAIDNTTGEPKKDSDYDGTLIYLKPSLIGGEPRDVVNYHRVSSAFPQDTIADQWFSEMQFESYRMLGQHVIDTICKANTPAANKNAREQFIEQVRVSVR